MDTNMIVTKLNAKSNGSYFNIKIIRELPITASAKKAGVTAYKETIMTVRKDIGYDAQKSVKEKVAKGKVLTHELPWGHWKIDDLIIEHKGIDYVRFYPTPNAPKHKYYMNGIEATLDTLKESGNLLKSAFGKPEKPDAFTIKVSNIVDIL